ncbi:hypothetical protein EVAR_6265_1 [Eumeta japonica]|uniref:Mos1 transposase HTH domain-containing protein n=1 Tax=Eumeta variegata TaxID=151549 RepID=A0A4C1T8G1_EUMVA|nr:hypothetical protein EVAR_6265_1 [Eumeta japonica]
MTLIREEFRAMIFYEFRCHLNQQESHNRLRLTFHDEASSLATVYNWYNEFKRGRTNLTICVKDILFKLTIETDNRVTYQQIRTSLSIGTSQVNKILHEYLAVRKLCTQRILDNLTDARKFRRINWCRKMMQRFSMVTQMLCTRWLQVRKAGFADTILKTKRHFAQYIEVGRDSDSGKKYLLPVSPRHLPEGRSFITIWPSASSARRRGTGNAQASCVFS